MVFLLLTLSGAIALVAWGINQGEPFTVLCGVAVLALSVVPFFLDDSDRDDDDDDWNEA